MFRPGLEEIMSSLLRTGTITNFKIHFDFVCFSFFLTHMEFLHSRRSLENHTRFQTKTDKVYTRFQTKTAKNPTPWGGTHLHGLYKGVPQPRPQGFSLSPGDEVGSTPRVYCYFVLHRGYSVGSYSVNLLWTRSLSKNNKMNKALVYYFNALVILL